MIRILHTGDLHLDSTFRGLTPEKARQRRQEQRDLLERLRTLTVEREIDVVLIAGDLFDGESVYYETTHMLSEVFARIPAKIFIAPGNHDPYSDYSPYASVRWPENVHLFKSNGMERVELPELNAVVYGTAFTSKYLDTSPLAGFSAKYDDESLTRIMVMHGDLSSPRSRYGALTGEQIASTGMDYVALGHIHRFIEVWKKGKTSFAYCGCPEGRGFDETGDKGVLIGTVAPGEAKLEFVPICRRRYQEVTVDVTGKDPVEALRNAVPAQAGEDIYRFRLTGERRGELDAAGLNAAVTGKFFAVQLLDETIAAVDEWERMEEDTLTGLFLRNMKTRLDNAGPEERPALERALRFGIAALEGREEPR